VNGNRIIVSLHIECDELCVWLPLFLPARRSVQELNVEISKSALTLWKFDLKEGWRQARITGNEQGFLDVKREGIEKNVAQDAGCMQYADLMD